MSWQAVARKDFRDAIRSKLFWALAIIFGLFAVGVGGAYGYFNELQGGGADQGVQLVMFVSSPVSIFVTLTAVIICHKTIVGERDAGSLKLMLSLPHSRFDVVLGKIVGRTAVLAVPALASVVLGVGVGSALLGDFAIVPSLVLVASMLVLVATYVSLMVGVSAMTSSTTLATVAAVMYFVVFEFVWDIIGVILLLVTVGASGTTNVNVDWYYVYTKIPPGNAFGTLFNAVLSEIGTTIPSAETANGMAAAQVDAIYGTVWIAIPILVFWLLVPAVIGYKRFSDADL